MGRRARLLGESEYDRKLVTGRFGRLLHDVVDGPAADDPDILTLPLPLGERMAENRKMAELPLH
jgi:hypothetical protein